MGERIVYFNGDFVPEAQARVSIYDTALATGEKIVEVTRTFNHAPYKLADHLERLYRGLEVLQIDPGMDPVQMAEVTDETLHRNLPTESEVVDWQILNYVSRGPAAQFEMVPAEELKPTVVIHCIPLVNRLGGMAKKYTNGIDLVVVEQRAIPQEVISPQIKSNGRMDHVIGRLEAKKIKPGSTGVLLDQNGYLTEATGSSLFLVNDDRIQTAPSSRVLSGLTREMIFDIAKKLGIPIEEQNLTVVDAMNASEIFITSTVICQVHARSFDGLFINSGLLGPITNQVRQAFIEEVGLDFAAQAQEYDHILRQQGPLR